MRLLFSAMPAGGHFRPIVPVARAALLAGHDVRVATPETAKAQVAAYGLVHLPAGRDWVGEEIRRTAHLTDLPPDHGDRLTDHLRTVGYPGPEALRTARDLLAHARSWRPDAVVRENAEFGGYLAAEALGVPHISLGAAGASASYLDPAVLAPALDTNRSHLGLPPDPEGRRIHAYLHANLMPAEYDPGELAIPHVRCYRQENPVLPGERLPAWAADLGSEPVLAAFGTLHPRGAAWRPVTEAVIAGLGALGRPAVVAVGTDPSALGRPPAGVRLVEHLPQPLALESAALFVHHGGFNSVRESVRCGVPMVIMPWFTDSLSNATHCAETGMAAVLPRHAVTPESVHQACATVLADPSYRENTLHMRRRMLALPPLDQLVADIEELTGATGR